MEKTFYKLVQENYDWFIASFAVIGVTIITTFTKTVSGIFGKHLQDSILQRSFFKLKKINIAKHPIFTKYHFLINQRIKHLRCHCPLRKKIFTDLMLARIESYDHNLKEFVKREDINSLSVVEFQYTMNELLLKIFTEWEANVHQQEIPAVIIGKFLEAIDDTRRLIVALTESISGSYYSYENNLFRVSAIFDVFNGLEEVIITQLEESLDQMNGEISNTEYKGTVCMHCVHCQSKHFTEFAGEEKCQKKF